MPKIELDAAVTGRAVKAAWKITDRQPDRRGREARVQSGDSLKAAWQSVTLDPALQQTSSGMMLGSATWSPVTPNRVIDVRIVAQDRAGNVGDCRPPRDPAAPLGRARLEAAGVSRTQIHSQRQSAVSNQQSSGDPFTSRQFGAGGTFDRDPEPKTPVANAPGSPRPLGRHALARRQQAAAPPSPHDKVANSGKAGDAAHRAVHSPASATSPPVADRVVAKPSSTGGGAAPTSGDPTLSSSQHEPPTAEPPAPLQPCPPPNHVASPTLSPL